MAKIKFNAFNISLLSVFAAALFLATIYYKSSNEKKVPNYFGDEIKGFCLNKICVRDESGWIVEIEGKKYPGETARIEELMNQFRLVKFGTPVSINKDKFNDFGIGNSTLVVDINNKRLEIGKLGGSFESSYVMAEDKVYEVPFVWNKSSMSSADYWKNKSVSNLPFYQVNKVIISRNNKETVLEAKDGKWEKENFVQKASHLSAKEYIDKPGKGSVETLTITVETDNSLRAKYSIGQWFKSRREVIYWARDEKNNYYQISKEDYDLLTR